MVMCDGDGDGKNEVFLMTASHLLAFRVENRQMVQIAEMVLPKGRNYVRLNSMDLGRNGRHELIVSAALKKEPRSLIVGFDGGKFSVQEDSIPYFLGVLNMPPAFAPTLVGQGVGRIKYLNSKIQPHCQSLSRRRTPMSEWPTGRCFPDRTHRRGCCGSTGATRDTR